mgnify:CR=1 FL=1
MSISFDTSGVDRLAADFGRAAGAVVPLARKALEVTSRYVKDDAVKSAKSANPSHARAYAPLIDYEFTGALRSEIGPRPQGQGKLGGILEDGGSPKHGVGNRPQKNLENAVRANVDDFVKGLEKAAGDALA